MGALKRAGTGLQTVSADLRKLAETDMMICPGTRPKTRDGCARSVRVECFELRIAKAHSSIPSGHNHNCTAFKTGSACAHL